MDVQVSLNLRSLRVNPRPSQLLPKEVAQQHHRDLIAALEAAQDAYEHEWRLAAAPFPYLCIEIRRGPDTPLVGLLADARNYPHRALSITVTDVTFSKLLQGVPRQAADTDRESLVFNKKTNRHWFCVPGTDEYHTQYSGVEPFDRIRGREEADPVQVITRCIRTIDIPALHEAIELQRSKAEANGEGEPP